MTDTAIDGDISDFFDTTGDMGAAFRADELRTYLLNEGHSEPTVDAAIRWWQEYRLQAVGPSPSTFKLTPAGVAAVVALRA